MKLYIQVLFTVGILVMACSGNDIAEDGDGKTAAQMDPRRSQIESLCGNCHLFVEPEMLSKAAWAKLLPYMGPRLGIFSHNGESYNSDRGAKNCEGLYPKDRLVSADIWQDVLNYYARYAPETNATQEKPVEYLKGLAMFKASEVNLKTPPIVSLSYIGDNEYYSYDAATQSIYIRDENHQLKSKSRYPNPISYIQPYEKGFLMTGIGSIPASDDWRGELIYAEKTGTGLVTKKVYLKEMERPVQFKLGDLDGDKKEDVVVCAFGNNRGSHYWLNIQGDTVVKHMLVQQPGAISTEIVDIDKDGDLDIITLFAQALEKVVLFENDGNGNFTEKQLLAFSPLQGSSSFQLADMNKDGILDIVYTCGDNADYSVVLKNFHGVYIYTGDKNGKYTQSYFYPMNGAFKAMAADFDQDGDMDLAAISFFADYEKQPDEGFLYFEQTATLKFKVKTHEQTHKGRWLTMDIGDIDKDGDTDILLGNFSMGPSMASDEIKEAWKIAPASMLLTNKLK